MQQSLFGQFLKIITPLTVLVVVAGVIDYHNEINKVRNDIAGEEEAHLTHGVVMIGSDLKSVAFDLIILANHAEFHLMDNRLGTQATDHLEQDMTLLLNSKQIYDQARYIDETGAEVVRINYDGKAAAVPEEKLQLKRDRYYFRDTIKLDKGGIYVSPLDLNVELGEVERPIKPMIRLGMPVFDRQGRKRGIVILNYRAAKLLRDFDVGVNDVPGTGMIANADGYWLRGPTPEMEWGFMLGHDETFPKHYPAAWSQIMSAESGQYENEAGLFTFATIYPTRLGSTSNGTANGADRGLVKADEYYWKAVSLVPAQTFAAISSATAKSVTLYFGTLYGILVVIVWLLARARSKFLHADATQRKSDLLSAKTHQLMEQVATAANEADTIFDAMQISLNAVCAYTGWPVGHYYALTGDGSGELASTNIWHLADSENFSAFREVSEKTRFAPGVGLPGRVLKSGEPAWIPDITKEPNYARTKLTEDIVVRAGFAFPILVGREVAGVLEFCSTEVREPDRALLEIMASIGTQLGRIVERQQAAKELRTVEEKSRLILEFAGEGVYGLDLRGCATFVNRAAAKMVGWEPEELLGKPQHDMLHHTKPDGSPYPREECPIYAAFKDGKVHHITDELFWRKDGSSFQVEYTATPIRIGDMITGAVVVFRDVTVRRQAEELLRNTQAMHEKAQSLAHLGHWELYFTDNKLSWSEETYRLFEQDPEGLDVTYDAFINVVHPDDRELVGKAFTGSVSSKIPYDIKHRLLMNDGRVKWVREQCETFYDDDGNPEHSIGTVLDITKIKEVEDKLLQAKEEADTANQAKSKFLSSMSHELRTPLNAILGFAQLLEYNPKEPLSTAQTGSVHRIINGGEHLLKLIDDVLNLAKVEAGMVELSIEGVVPVKVLNVCIPLISGMAEKRSIAIEVDLKSEALPSISADGMRYKQALLNLITNAIKYNHDGGKVMVEMGEVTDSMLRVSVSDTGPGIPDSRKGELFQPFSRLGAEVTEIEGTGIGLTITKQLVELMGGRIGFESEVGRGSTFWIDMPIMAEEGAGADDAGADDAGAAQGETGKSFPRIDGAVLYVEDNLANLELMEQIVLRIPGLEIISAHNAELGLELAESRHPDLIILDINLPGMDGFEALGKLRENDTTKDIPVIALSASAMQCDYEKGVAAGFDRYLTKPFKVDEVVESIRQQIAAAG